jgi:Cft2 family RNA processing exonuclease
MELVNLTLRTEIGSNSYWLRIGGKNIILDAGLHPKLEGLAATPDFSPVPSGTVDAIFITHAHQDHLGALPVLTRREPAARVFLTPPTARLADVMLHNSVNVMNRQREDDGISSRTGASISARNPGIRCPSDAVSTCWAIPRRTKAR